MVHSLRKYLSNRGSALFMVLSTMTALMITCMAMYFAVVSSRSAGFAVFNQQQSYQSAMSISEMVVADLSTILTNSGVDIESVKVGDTIITTDGNGFKTLNSGASNADDHYLGAYDVTMTRLADEKIDNETYFTVDIAVTTSVSGVKEVYHQVVNIIQEEGSPDRKGKIFASTGYVPNDSFISKGRFFSDVYVSNEDTVLGAFDGKELHFFQNIFCENSLTVLDEKTPQNYKKNPIVHAVRGDYNIGTGNPIGFSGGSYIFVGNDMHVARGLNVSSGTGDLEVYVAGDLYLESGASNLNSSRVKFYVAGDVYLKTGTAGAVPGVLYCHKFHGLELLNETDRNNLLNSSAFGQGLDWKTDQDKKHGVMSLSFSDAMTMLDEKTPDIKYKLWQLDESKLKGAIGETQSDGTIKGGTEKTLNFKSIDYQNVYKPITITYGSEKDGVGCIIQDIYLDRNEDENGKLLEGFARGGGTEDGKMPTLIIDTGNDSSNTFVIRLQANNTYTYKDSSNKDVTVNYFSWRPKTSSGLAWYPIQVLVKGNGSVVIDVPDGVVYQDSSYCHIMHYNWYMLGDTNSGLGYQNGVAYYKNSQGIQGTISDYVHSSCDDDCNCRYTTKKTSEACAYCGNEITYSVKCSLHEEYTICPNCDSEYFSGDEKNPTINPVGICKDRVERQKCINSLAAIDSADRPVNREKVKDNVTGKLKETGDIIVPNCNIYLISCSESAAFRFGRTIDDKSTIDKNCFMGFIYAPYMSYKANGADAGEYYMHVGGMVVSDYKFLSLNRFLACWPSVYPPENVLDQDSLSSTLNPVSEKRYRVKLKATY